MCCEVEHFKKLIFAMLFLDKSQLFKEWFALLYFTMSVSWSAMLTKSYIPLLVSLGVSSVLPLIS